VAKYVIREGKPLKGTVKIDGAKNSIEPIIAASLLADGQCVIEEIPFFNDISVMCDIIRTLGADVKIVHNENKIVINTANITSTTGPYELVNKVRASFLIMGPLLARMGKAIVPMPGGCPIGARPIDLHLKGFAALGAEIKQGHGFVEAYTKGKLKGNKIYLDFPSVGATENIMMAAVLAEGQTIIENAAVEPEIVDLAIYLTAMGADIKGAGTDTIRINGVDHLSGVTHSVIPDRIEAGTYMVAAAITGGDIIIDNVLPDHLKPVTAKLREANIEVIEEMSSIRVIGGKPIKAVDIKTQPYPGFPTDMQAQMMALLSKAEGTSIIIETIFENRFMHVPELKRMGANIKLEGRSAIVEGVPKLSGAQVKATDLRAGAALIVAGLAAEGETEIDCIEHIERGYYNIVEKFRMLGADITRID